MFQVSVPEKHSKAIPKITRKYIQISKTKYNQPLTIQTPPIHNEKSINLRLFRLLALGIYFPMTSLCTRDLSRASKPISSPAAAPLFRELRSLAIEMREGPERYSFWTIEGSVTRDRERESEVTDDGNVFLAKGRAKATDFYLAWPRESKAIELHLIVSLNGDEANMGVGHTPVFF